MSLLNVWHDPDAITIGVDSLGSGLGRPVTLSKVVYLPGHRAAVAGRGSHTVFSMLAASLMLDVSGSFDALRMLVPEVLERAWRVHLEVLDAHPAPVPSGPTSVRAGQDIALCGWSAARCRFASVVYTIRDGEPCTCFELGDDGGAEYFCASWDEDSGDLPECETDAEMLGSMRVQMAADRKRNGVRARSGGPLWLLTMTQSGVTMATAPA